MPLADADLPVWTFAADFSSDVIETIEFATDIITSETGSEQRRSTRVGPRRYFEFALAEWGSARTYLDLAIRRDGGQDWHLPVWTDGTYLTVNCAGGNVFLAVDSVEPEFVIGGYAFVCGPDARTGEKVKVSGLNGGGYYHGGKLDTPAGLAAPLGSDWPAGAQVYPLVRASLTDQPTLSRKSGRAITSNAKFLLAGPNDFPPLDPATMDQYRGAPVYRTRPNLLNDSDYTYSRQLVDFDSDTGLKTRVDTGLQGFTGQQYEYLIYGRSEHASFKALMYWLRGRQRSMWMPSFMEDLFVIADTPAGGYELQVEYVGLSYLGIDVGREDLCIEFEDGRPAFYARIVSAKVTAQGETLLLDTPLPAGLLAEDVQRVSFMEKCRQDQDAIEITHKADVTGASTAATNYRAYSDTRVDYIGPVYTPIRQFAHSIGRAAVLYLPRIPAPGDAILTIYMSFVTGDGSLDYDGAGQGSGMTDFNHGGVYVQTFINGVGGNGVLKNTRPVSCGVAFELPPLPDRYTGANGTPVQNYPQVGFGADYNENQEYTLTSQATTTAKSLVIAFACSQVKDVTGAHVSSGATAYITGDGDLQAQSPSFDPNPGFSCRAIELDGPGQTATFNAIFLPGTGGDDPNPFQMSFFVLTIPLTEN